MALVAYDANSDSDISEDEEENLIRSNTQVKKLEIESHQRQLKLMAKSVMRTSFLTQTLLESLKRNLT
jgi:hypothetical protein